LLKLCGKTKKTGGKIIVEIGFGNGITTAMMAEKNPHNIYIGIEVYKPGIGNLLKLIDEKKLCNVVIINHDAVEVIEKFKRFLKIDAFHIFFPDPWQKRKHVKRRIINETFVASMLDLLDTDSYIYVVTDWKDYAQQIQNVMRSFNKLFSLFDMFVAADYNAEKTNCSKSSYISELKIPWRPETNFEIKGKKHGRNIYESFFICR
jgi:tRNA (guanine-N7-)-methyltransferase